LGNENWIEVLSADQLPIDDVVGVETAGKEIAIYTVGDRIYATDNICSHGQARLCDGFLEGHAIECPLHQGKFDVRDGKPICEPAFEPLRTYAVKVDGTRVLIRIE
jgi:naphthalene 1,2-dioxygenase system ferredoxin subunit